MTKSFSGLSYGLYRIRKALSGKYKHWKDTRFLKKHGCKNWNEYNHRFDPDIFIRAQRINDYYYGYPYVYCLEHRSHYAYQLLYDYGPGGCRHGYDDIVDWCKKNTKHKHRTDMHRAHKGIAYNNGNPIDDWWFNEIAGGDYLFFAFKDEKDYNWFLMRWS